MNSKIVLVSIISFFTSCFSVENSQKKNVSIDYNKLSEVVYKFNDSSVPPPYHRSYLIVADNNNIKLTVDSYGDILVDTTFQFSEQQFEDLKDVIKKANFSRIDKRNKELDMCTGGTSEDLRLKSKNEVLLDGDFVYCGGEVGGNLSGDIKSVAKHLKSQIVDFKSYLQ